MPSPRRNEETTAAMARVDAPQLWANSRNQMTSYARPVAPDAKKSAVAAASPRTLPNPRLHVDQHRMPSGRRLFPQKVYGQTQKNSPCVGVAAAVEASLAIAARASTRSRRSPALRPNRPHWVLASHFLHCSTGLPAVSDAS